MLFDGFFRGRSLAGRSRRRGRRTVPRHDVAFSPEVLEPRLPLAYNITATTLTTTPATFAYNITIDDQVDSSGFGRDIYLARFDSGTPLVKIADNPSFNNATTLGLIVGSSQCTTFFVTSAGHQKSLFATSDPATIVPNAIPINTVGNFASFNLADKTDPLLQGINPLGISGRGVIDYTDPDGGIHFLAFNYQVGSLAAFGGGAITFTQINPDDWSDAKLAVPTGTVFTSYSPLTSDYVTSVSFRFPTSSGDFGSLDNLDVTNAPYEYFDPSPAHPQSFTVSQGQDLDQRLIVDLAPVGSRISINSSWYGKLGDDVGDTPGVDVDPIFYRAYDGVIGVGQLNLYASEVTINQDVSSVNRIAIGGPRNVLTRSGDLDPTSPTPNVVTNVSSVANLYGGGGLFVSGPGIQPDTTVVAVDSFTNSITLSKPPLSAQTNVSLKFTVPRPSGYTRETSSLRVLANAEAPSFDLEVAGSQGAHGEIFVSQAGSLTGLNGALAGALAVDAQSTDIRFEGNVSAASQGYFLSAQGSADQYEFTTRSSSTGTQTGLLTGDTVAFTLGQPGGGTVDLKTAVNNLRFDSGVSASGVPFRYTVAIEDTNDLTVDSVAASSGPITLASATGKLSIKGSAVRTAGDLTVMAATSLSFDGSVSSSNGNVLLVSPTLTLGSSVTAGGARGVSLQSKTGPSTINALVQAGGQLKTPVRAATTAAVDLATGGLLTIDGVTLTTGDRVLVKNQSSATENGIYVVSAGSWIRATDANTSALLVPGFVTFAIEGQTQKGGWVFQNPANPILGQTGTGLAFVPVTATLAYGPAKAATTGAIDLTTNGLTAVDGVTLTEGDRVLVKNQANQADNGIYLASVGPWVRASDADTTAELRAGSYVFITSGTTNGGQGFALLNDAVQVGTTDLRFGGFLVESQRSNFWSPSNTIGSVRVATTVNLEALAGLLTIDGVKLAAGDRVLVKNQITPSANGVYLAAAGAWTRASDASLGANFAYDTFVYVSEGTVGRGTGWLVDNSIVMTATLTADSNLLTGLRSTEGLTIGMAVEGEGIPAGSTITGVGADGTSVFLSQNAIATATLSLVRFASFTNPTVGVTPLVFRATGGNVSVASAGDISGSPTQGRLQGQNVVLTAGTGGTGLINTKTTASTVSAVAPGSITLDNASQVELADVRSGTAADVVVLSAGTLTATSVAAGGNVSLSSTYGDVVAGRVGSTVGTITLSSLVSNTAIANATGTARVAAQNGSVIARADKGAVIVNGQVAAQGPGSDVSFISNYVSQTSSDPSAVRFGPLADVSASDQLIIDAPNSMPVVDPLAKLTAARLSLRSKLFANTAPPASLGSYPTVLINRTDAGNIDYTSISSLTVEGATTVNGSIAFTAPDLKVTGGIATVGANTDVTLTASTNNLFIDGTVTSQRDVTLNAVGGSITNSAAGRTTLITAPRNVIVAADKTATLLTKAQALTATLTSVGSTLDVQDDDGLVITSAVLSGGGNATFKVGTAALGGSTLVGLIDAGQSGTVSIDSYGDIVEATVDPTADIVAQSATFKSANGRIDLDTTVDVLTASTLQKTAPITLRDQGTGTTPLQLASLTGVGTGADITVTSARTIQATAVTTAGRVNLTTTSPAASVQVGTVTATGNTATITSAGSIAKLTPASLITATSVVLDSASGSIDAMLAASNVAAATGAGGAISLQDADSLSIGNDLLARGISTTGPVSITVGGALTQSQSVVGQSLVATSTGGVITLTNANNDVDSLTVNNGNRAVSFTDKDDLSIASIVGGPITLAVGGNLVQTGPITGTTLGITANAGTVSLTNPGNDVDSLSVNNGLRAVSFTDKDDLLINGAGIIGGTISVTAGTALAIASPVTAGTSTAGDGDITLTSTSGSIALAATLTAKADRVTLNASSGTITQTAGIIDSQTLVWYAQSLPTPNPLAGSYSIVGPNLTAAGNLVLVYATSITIAGASTVNGTITITAPSVRIIDTVKTAAGNAVSVTATSGGIEFAEQLGGIVTSPSGAVTLSATSGSVTATNKATRTTVRGGALTVTAQSADLKLNVQSFSSTVTSGGLTVSAVDGLALGPISAAGQPVTLSAVSGITQTTGSITAASLTATNGAGAVVLTAPANSVSDISIVNGNGDVSFVNAGTFSVTAPGVSTGSAATGDGNVSLKSMSGGIALNANVAAPGDRVTLEARNGAISQQPATSITAQSLVWYAQSAPSLAGSYSSVGANLTTSGPLTLGPFAQPVTITGATTVDGDITITAPDVVITDPVIAGGAARSITVTATNGGIGVQSKGLLQTTGGVVSLSATGAITAANAASVTTITGSELAIFAGGPATLSTSSIGLGNVSVNGPLTLATKGALAQKTAATIQAAALDITGVGSAITLANVGNNVGTLSVRNGAGAFSYRDTNELLIDTIVGGAVTLSVGTPIVPGPSLSQTASGSITATTLDITSTARGVQLTNAANDVGTLSVSNPGRVVSFTDKNDLVIAGLTASSATLTVGGRLTQNSSPITCSLLTVISMATQNGGVLLNTAMNDVDTLSVSNPGRRVMFTDTDDLSLAGIAADSTTLSVGGNLTQSSQIVGNSLTVAATAGSVTLTNAANSVAAASISNGNRAVSFVNASALTLGGLTMGTGSLTVGGDLAQTGPITGSSLGITSTAGTINLLNSANNLDALTVSNGSRLFSYADTSSVAITSVGTLSVGTVTALQQLTVTTTNGGSVDVGPQANGLLQAGGTLDLRAVQGSIGIRNNGRIVGNPILLPPGKGIQVGGTITTPAQLNSAITTINSLPIIPGSNYEILVAASMTLTQQLSVSRPVTFRGTSQSIVLSGNSSVTNGLLLDSGASGSVIRDIAFSSFSSDAIRLTSTASTLITGIRVSNSGNGLAINGTSANTVVQGNTFDRNQTGVSLISATGALVGGAATGQGNVISSEVRQGVFASGFCTGSQVVKNTFPGTATPYNVSASRNLTIVN
jgi:hypothetical protein